MVKPVILAVDDDRAVLTAVAGDLRPQYGRDYRVETAISGQEALSLLRELKKRNRPVALLLADQRMPEMDGVTFLQQAKDLYPDAKRALLTAYADTEAAISAINDVALDYYLLKPWDPPEDRLYPVLDDLLVPWRPPRPPPDLRIVGHRWSRPSSTLRTFLTRNLVPYRWLEIERDEEAEQLLELAGIDASRLPVAVLDDTGRCRSHVEPPDADECRDKDEHAKEHTLNTVPCLEAPVVDNPQEREEKRRVCFDIDVTDTCEPERLPQVCASLRTMTDIPATILLRSRMSDRAKTRSHWLQRVARSLR
jgi:CheY-like chemotaxis protein